MRFVELSSAQVAENKRAVISKRDDGKVSLAQQITAESEGEQYSMFMKNAIITTVEGLEGLYTAIGEALDKIHKDQKS